MAKGEKYTEEEIEKITSLFGYADYPTDEDISKLSTELARTNGGLISKAVSLGLIASPDPESSTNKYADKDYSELLKHPFWQRKRLEIMDRDKWACVKCSDIETTLHVHHLQYNNGCAPWEYDNKYLVTLCKDCHAEVEKIKKQKEIEFADVSFQELSIYKSNGWADGTKIMFISAKSICSMSIYDKDDNWIIGFYFGENSVRQIIDVLTKTYV